MKTYDVAKYEALLKERLDAFVGRSYGPVAAREMEEMVEGVMRIAIDNEGLPPDPAEFLRGVNTPVIAHGAKC